MLRRNLGRASSWQKLPICLFCAARTQPQRSNVRSISATDPLLKRKKASSKGTKTDEDGEKSLITYHASIPKYDQDPPSTPLPESHNKKSAAASKVRVRKVDPAEKKGKRTVTSKALQLQPKDKPISKGNEAPKSLKEALLGAEGLASASASKKQRKKREEQLQIQELDAELLKFEPIQVEIPPVPMLSYGLDRVLFNPGVYRLQDPRSRIFNFDPYLERIMPVNEFDFDALSEYKTSSKDETLIALTKQQGTKFTGSTSSMSSVLQHFHFLLSNFRSLNHNMMSRGFPDPSPRFSKITTGPSAVFLRYKDGVYAIDADKSYDTPNIMSWLGHSLEKLLTTDRNEFELFRRSSTDRAPSEDDSSRCYHYSRQGNILMRSQLDAQDPRLPGTGVFDLKTRAVVSIRMNHREYESGSGYQLRFAQGEWESFEREFYDMTRATLLKYSLQVRMGRMDGIFLAFHNIERIFGFQYLNLPDLDRVLHGQEDTTLGDQEFRLSISLLDELLCKATAMFPETSIRIHVETRNTKTPFMYVFAEPVTEEQADEIQSAGEAEQKEFARTVVGVGKNDPEVQEAWQNIQDEVDEQTDKDKDGTAVNGNEASNKQDLEQEESSNDVAETSDTEVTNHVSSPESEGAKPVETEESEEITEVAESAESAETTEPAEAAKITEAAESAEATDVADARPSGPLMGWTLTVRNKVNGGYVERPSKLQEDDDWKIEYIIQDIPEESRWRLYGALKDRRRGLIADKDKEVDKSLQNYRALIQRYSNHGREWRKKQDELNEEMGIHMYKPLGPGSEAASAASTTIGTSTGKEEP